MTINRENEDMMRKLALKQRGKDSSETSTVLRLASLAGIEIPSESLPRESNGREGNGSRARRRRRSASGSGSVSSASSEEDARGSGRDGTLKRKRTESNGSSRMRSDVILARNRTSSSSTANKARISPSRYDQI
jgi:hypothetical protein